MLNSLIDASKRDIPVVLQRGDVEDRGVTGWMMSLGRLFGCANRFAILLRLEEKDTSLAEFASMLKTDPSNASRHLKILRSAQVVVEQYVGFRRGPRKVFCLTQLGQQLLQGMREVALQVVRTQFKGLDEFSEEMTVFSRRIVGKKVIDGSARTIGIARYLWFKLPPGKVELSIQGLHDEISVDISNIAAVGSAILLSYTVNEAEEVGAVDLQRLQKEVLIEVQKLIIR